MAEVQVSSSLAPQPTATESSSGSDECFLLELPVELLVHIIDLALAPILADTDRTDRHTCYPNPPPMRASHVLRQETIPIWVEHRDVESERVMASGEARTKQLSKRSESVGLPAVANGGVMSRYTLTLQRREYKKRSAQVMLLDSCELLRAYGSKMTRVANGKIEAHQLGGRELVVSNVAQGRN